MLDNNGSLQQRWSDVLKIAEEEPSVGAINPAREAAPAQQDLPVLLLMELLARALEQALETLEHDGASALKREDFAVAVTSLKRAVVVQAIRDGVQKLQADWESLQAMG